MPKLDDEYEKKKMRWARANWKTGKTVSEEERRQARLEFRSLQAQRLMERAQRLLDDAD